MDSFPSFSEIHSLIQESEFYPVISKSSVLVVGAGGIGCEVIKSLILAGFTKFQVVDFDTIDYSNLHRQFLFSPHNVGQSKALVAGQRISSRYPELEVACHFANVCDTRLFPFSFFKKFDIIINGLDNLEARRYVNRICVFGKIPLVESGTAGLLGQTRLIVPDESECFDCRAHPQPTTFPVCTIRSTPSTLAHCVVWAKDYLFNSIFSPNTNPDEDGSDEIEDEAIREILEASLLSLKQIREISNKHQKANKLLEFAFVSEIERIAKYDSVWKAANRSPPVAIVPGDEVEWQNLFTSSFCQLASRSGPLTFDKDDDTVMDFVAAASNLRALCFGIDRDSVFNIKAIAGNIIPSISTTNALIASLAVNCAFNYLLHNHTSDTIYVTNTDRLLIREQASAPSATCSVCSLSRILIPNKETILEDVVSFVQREFTDSELQIFEGSRLLYDSFDFTSNARRTLESLQVSANQFIEIHTVNYHILSLIADESSCTEIQLVLKKESRVEEDKENSSEEREYKKSKLESSDPILEESDDLEIL